MNQLATQPVIAADTYGALPPFRSGRQELQRGYDLYVAKRPLEACDGLMQRRGWHMGNVAEAMATMPVEVTL